MKSSALPVTFDSCGNCGFCVSVCPTDAISITQDGVVTETEKEYDVHGLCCEMSCESPYSSSSGSGGDESETGRVQRCSRGE